MNTKRRREHKTGRVREVIKCDLNGSQIHVFSSLKEAAQRVNSKTKNPSSNICGALNGRENTAFGFKWVYSDDEIIDGEVWGNVDTCRHKNATVTPNFPCEVVLRVSWHIMLSHLFTFLEKVPGSFIVNHNLGTT